MEQFTRDLEEALTEGKSSVPLVMDKSPSQLVDIIPQLNTVKANIESTKQSLLREVVADESLQLLLYASRDPTLLVPWWSTTLFRIDMAQTIIQRSHGDPDKYETIGKELYTDSPSLEHVLNALKNADNIIEELSKDPEVYKRAEAWMKGKKINGVKITEDEIETKYIGLCMQCFCAFYYAERKQGKVQDLFLVQNADGSYGLYDDEDKYNIKTKHTVLQRRESMVWFAKEVANAYLFQLDWDNAIKWSRLVYNMLTNV